MQPNYSQSVYKQKARNLNVKIYRSIMGFKSIPADRSYWTLCNKQPNASGSEICQLATEGLLLPNQFNGVDRDEEIINFNKKTHPDAHWHHGDWLEVIEDIDNFNPAMIYLDTTSFADHSVATNMVVRTMMNCPNKCILLANVMLNDPRSRRQFNETTLVKNISRQIPPSILKEWNFKIPNYDYSATGRTFMKTYVFCKE